MKTVYIIGGTMGVGKTTVCQLMKKQLADSVFLDGDWCWDSSPFQVTEATKKMVMENICFLLNRFIHCPAYQNIIFCWVLHEQSIIDNILSAIDFSDCRVKVVSLICDEENLRRRLAKDISDGIRTADVIDRSVSRIANYMALNTVKVDTNAKTPEEIAGEIMSL